MNIAMVTPWGKNVKCGIRTYSENLVSALVKNSDVNVYIIRWPRFGYRTKELIQNCVVDKIPADKIDLIHTQMEYGLFEPDLTGVFYAGIKQYGKPIVTTMHATGNFVVDKIVSAISDKVIVHNEHMAKLFNMDCEIIPHGCHPAKCPPIDECKESLGIDPEIPVVGYVGFISPVKGLETLIEAMVDVKGLLLIGGGWFVDRETEYIERLKQWSARLLGNRCAWLGFVKDEDLARVYGACDIIVYPSRYISESGAMLMAISHGKAVIARSLPSTREKERNGILLTFDTTHKLTEIINSLLNDDVVRSELETRAMEYANNNSWDNVSKKHLALYHDLLMSKS